VLPAPCPQPTTTIITNPVTAMITRCFISRSSYAIHPSAWKCRVLGSTLGGGHRTLGWAVTPTPSAEGRRRTLHAIHTPPITISKAPTSTVGGVLAAPSVIAYTRPKGYMNTAAPA
jgi:hypothetical protein